MCSIDYCDEYSDVWIEKWRTARKAHKCYECGRSVKAGERYRFYKSLFDSRWFEWKTCQHCRTAGFWLDTVCGGYLSGGLFEELKDHWDEGYRSVGMGRLILGMRKQWHGGTDPIPDGEAVEKLAKSMMRKSVA